MRSAWNALGRSYAAGICGIIPSGVKKRLLPWIFIALPRKTPCMSTAKTLSRTFSTRGTIEGAGVWLHRAFGYDQLPLFDPFLMFDDF